MSVFTACPQHCLTSRALEGRPTWSKCSMNRASNNIKTILNSPHEAPCPVTVQKRWRRQQTLMRSRELCTQNNSDCWFNKSRMSWGLGWLKILNYVISDECQMNFSIHCLIFQWSWLILRQKLSLIIQFCTETLIRHVLWYAKTLPICFNCSWQILLKMKP